MPYFQRVIISSMLLLASCSPFRQFKMFVELSSMITFCACSWFNIWFPIINAQASTKWFVWVPRFSAYARIISLVWFLMTPPTLASSGVPFEAPSKFSFNDWIGGHCHLVLKRFVFHWGLEYGVPWRPHFEVITVSFAGSIGFWIALYWCFQVIELQF